MSPFEIIMILCFGAAWPFSIVRSLKSRSTQGKSPFFLAVIFTGYLAGLLHKILYSLDPVIILYALNTLMVGFDLILYFRNRRHERAAGR